ncbi:MAG: hypothetical protein ABIQ59_06040 [Nocardioidaceae bacterium]
MVRTQQAFEVTGRALFYLPPAWPLAVAALSVSKILDNMEIGHNVMHGQYDWMGDPVYAFLLMVFFEWGVLRHDLEVENIVAGQRSWADTEHLHRGMIRKIRNQTLKDYVLFPALTGPLFPLTFAGNLTANLIRNVWTFGSSSAATSRRESPRSPRRRPKTSRAASGTTDGCPGPRTSPAASCST